MISLVFLFLIFSFIFSSNSLVAYILFPVNDDDIDNPSAYQLFTVKLPKKGYKAMTRSSRQIDLAGNSIVGTNLSYYERIGRNLLNNENGKSIGIKVNFGWTNDDLGNKNLVVLTKPIMPVY